MKNSFFAGLLSLTIMISCQPDKQLTNYVNPLLGTATLWETKDLGYERHLKTRTWGGRSLSRFFRPECDGTAESGDSVPEWGRLPV